MYQITKLKYVLFLNLIVMTLLLGSCGNETTTSPKIGYLGFYLGDMKDTVITKLEDLKNNGNIKQLNIRKGDIDFSYPYSSKYSENVEVILSFHQGLLSNIDVIFPSKLQYDEVVDLYRKEYKNKIVIDTVRSSDNLVLINYFVEIDSLTYFNIGEGNQVFTISYSKIWFNK